MDASQLLELARQALTYMTPLIVGGALAKVGEDALGGPTALAQRTWSMLRTTLQGNAEAEAALTLYKLKPANDDRRHIVEGELVTVLQQRPELIAELLELVTHARALGLLTALPSRTHTQNIGGNAQVGVAVAGDVHGNITHNQPQGDVVQHKVVHYGAPRLADTNPEHLRNLIDINTRRLRVLEAQAKRFGYSVPPHIETEIEDIRADNARLDALQESSNASRISASSFDERRLDAAIPQKVQKDRPTELRAMIALTHSQGLRARLPDFTSTGEVITKEDVQGTSIQVEFKTNVTRLLLEIDALDFQVVRPEQIVIVPHGIESGVVLFSLLPRKLSTNAKIFLRVFTMPPDRALIDTLVLEANIQPQMVSLASWTIVSRALFFR